MLVTKASGITAETSGVAAEAVELLKGNGFIRKSLTCAFPFRTQSTLS